MNSVKTLIDDAVKVCKSRYVIAQRLGVDEGNLGKMYNGKLTMPPALAVRIAELAHVDPVEALRVATVEREKDPQMRAELARLLRVPATAAMSAAALLGAQNSHADQILSATVSAIVCVLCK